MVGSEAADDPGLPLSAGHNPTACQRTRGTTKEMSEERKSAAVRKTPTSARPSPLKKDDVRYLAFEGGGGKGVTYLGAIQALEDLKVLPIDKPPGKNRILGIAGASAGAITALVLALGYSAANLKTLLEDQDKFNSFFDGPNPGK